MVRFGIAGTGRISDWALRGAVQDRRFKAAAVCSRSRERGEEFIRKHPEAFTADARVFTSFGQMAASSGLDAIYIATPNSTHCDYAITALRAGKHVLCEKPLACSAEEVRMMTEASRKSGKALMEAMISTLNPNFLAAREMIPAIAPVRHYNSSFCQYSSRYDELKKGIVSNSFNPLSGGGASGDVGIYVTYPAVVLFGRPLSVKSNIVRFDTAYGSTDVHGTILLEYPDMTAVLSYSKVVDSFAPTEICAEKGNLILDETHICRQLSFCPHRTPTSGRGEKCTPNVLRSGLERDEYFYEFEEFISVIERGDIESRINSHEISLINREILDAALTEV